MTLVRRPSRWTLRTRLLVVLILIAIVGLGSFGVLSLSLLERSQADRVDAQLNLVATDLKSSQRKPPTLESQSPSEDVPSEFRLMFYDSAGTLVGRLGAPVGSSTFPVLPAMDADAVRARGDVAFSVPDQSSDTHWRVRTFVQPAVDGRPGGGTAAVAISLATTEATTAHLRTIELAAGVALTVAMSVIAALLVRVGLRPLTRIEHTANAIAAGDFDRRVLDTDPHTETGRLGAAFNVMVTRLAAAMRRSEQSEQRMRTFVADASHELRTPLTTVRGFAELYRRGPNRTDPDALDMMGRIEAAATRMGVLVEDLLLLAQLDEERPLDLSRVDIGALASDVVADARHRAPDRRIDLWVEPGAARVLGDEQRLHQAVTNLVTNALVHTPDSATITVTVDTRDAAASILAEVDAEVGGGSADAGTYLVVEVADDGPGIAAEKAAHVFDRFYKVSESRTGRSGSGLGLAITAAIVIAHDARLQLSTGTGRGAVFRILLHAD